MLAFVIGALAVGALIGLGFGWVLWRKSPALAATRQQIKSLEEDKAGLKMELSKSQDAVLELNRQIAKFEASVPELEQAKGQLKSDLDQLQKLAIERQETIANITAEKKSLETEKALLNQQLENQTSFIEELRKQAKTEFENLANEILKARSKDLTETSEKNLEAVLKPLREKLGTFEKQVAETYEKESREVLLLKSEVERLIGLGNQMTTETKSLTEALRGDSKTQGDWGELVLERILESSGLTEGREYHAQKSHENEDGNRMRPDFRIDLPDDKHLIVDSKVSLTAYERFVRAQADEEREAALTAHLKSVEKHIDELGDKHYSKLKGIKSPEFVFLFVPIEPAYLLAMQSDLTLSERAWRKGVAIVTGTTLLTSLKTVASIWRLEKQNRNALTIADEAGKLYDKFVGFLDEFTKIEKTFETGQAQFRTAMDRLKTGRGNVFKRMELIRNLGAAPKNRIKPELLEAADSDDVTLVELPEAEAASVTE